MSPLTLMLTVLCVVLIVVATIKRLLWLVCIAVAILVLQQLGVWENVWGVFASLLVDGPIPTPAFLLPFLPQG